MCSRADLSRPASQSGGLRTVRTGAATAIGLAWLLLGSAPAAQANPIFDANCAVCHQKGAVGVPGQFPRLAGRVRAIAATAAGRRYLVEVVSFGMAGRVEVDGVAIMGVMPPLGTLTDDDVAVVLNYLIGLQGPDKSKAKPGHITASEVKTARAGASLSPGQVHSDREAIVEAGIK
jgi:mono/diheme cytochrome c family protein